MSNTSHFTLKAAPTFPADAYISVPGEVERAHIVFTFKHKKRRALAEWSARVDKRTAAQPDSALDLALLTEVVAGWSGPRQSLDEAAPPVPYTEQALEEMLEEYPGSFIEIVGAYIAGLTRARTKNSGRL